MTAQPDRHTDEFQWSDTRESSPRSDSKNPATTCKGLTTNGRPCRRALATCTNSFPLPLPHQDNGVLAVLNKINAAAFYCWQHKDQAETLAAQPEQQTTLYPLRERSSIDTLIHRVGILDLDEDISKPKKSRHRRRRSDGQHLTRRETLPAGWNRIQEPLMTVPEDVKHKELSRHKHYKYGRSNVKASWTCCIRAEDDEPPAPRPRPRRDNGPTLSSAYTRPAPMTVPLNRHEVRRKPVSSNQTEMTQRVTQPPTTSNSNSQTQTLLSHIPSTLSPQTTSALLTELSRPISPHDEAGYIYIFWLTPDSEVSKPDDETASSLLDDDDIITSPNRHQRTSIALQRYASVRNRTETRTILLKIGRAANVHRRMSQWTKQCGQNITLIRYYPYSPSQLHSAIENQTQSKKVPHVHRVERLIHLELNEKRAEKDGCAQCGREHKEWFEVEASKRGLQGVDEVIRRWVTWAENTQPGRGKAEEGIARPAPTARGSGRVTVEGYY